MLVYSTGGGLRWVRDVHDEDHKAMKAEGHARLEPPGNSGCVSTDLCVCAGGCGIHTVLGDECPNGGGNGLPTRTRSCFAACVLLCNLVAALHP